MINRYITALFVILAATGVEAQNYRVVLKLAMTDISYEEFAARPEARALKSDILSVIRLVKQEDAAKRNPYSPCLGVGWLSAGRSFADAGEWSPAPLPSDGRGFVPGPQGGSNAIRGPDPSPAAGSLAACL